MSPSPDTCTSDLLWHSSFAPSDPFPARRVQESRVCAAWVGDDGCKAVVAWGMQLGLWPPRPGGGGVSLLLLLRLCCCCASAAAATSHTVRFGFCFQK